MNDSDGFASPLVGLLVGVVDELLLGDEYCSCISDGNLEVTICFNSSTVNMMATGSTLALFFIDAEDTNRGC
jgi:hypothetical protein